MSEFTESELIFVRDFDDEIWKLFHYIGRTKNGCFMCVAEDSHEDFCNGGFYCQVFIQGRKASNCEVTQFREDKHKENESILRIFTDIAGSKENE